MHLELDMIRSWKDKYFSRSCLPYKILQTPYSTTADSLHGIACKIILLSHLRSISYIEIQGKSHIKMMNQKKSAIITMIRKADSTPDIPPTFRNLEIKGDEKPNQTKINLQSIAMKDCLKESKFQNLLNDSIKTI